VAADASAAFFSYCRDDSDFALRLAEDLKAAGAAVWIDQLDIEPGMRWDRAVETALSNCPRMLVILSPVSVESDNVRDEISFALRKQKTIIPVLYLDCDIPLRLERHQHIDFRTDHARGLKVLLKALGVQPTTQPTTHAPPPKERKQAARPARQKQDRAARKTAVREERGTVPAFDDRARVWKLRELRTLEGHRDTVLGVALTGDGQRAVSASLDETLKVWDVASGRELHSLEGHTSWVNDVALSRDGRLAVSASTDNTLRVWDVESGFAQRILRGHSGAVNGVALSADGWLAVSASADKTLKVWELDSGRELRTLTGHAHVLRAVAVTPDGQRAISASYDRTLKVWELAGGRELRTFTGHSAEVMAVAVTPDGQRAVSASADQTLKVWELDSGRELRTLTGHSGSVYAVAVTPDGQRVVSASGDQTLKEWEMDSGRELASFKANTGLLSCAVLPDGKTILAGDDKGVIHCLRLE